MAWRRSGDKPLSEPVVISLSTHICVTRPQWVKPIRFISSCTVKDTVVFSSILDITCRYHVKHSLHPVAPCVWRWWYFTTYVFRNLLYIPVGIQLQRSVFVNTACYLSSSLDALLHLFHPCLDADVVVTYMYSKTKSMLFPEIPRVTW